MAAQKMFRAVIVGAPGAGKGTISTRIVKHFDIVHISSGDKLRQNIQNHTPIGAEAQQYIQSGKLVPDETMIKFIMNEIKSIGNQPWLLDAIVSYLELLVGFPRTLAQAVALWQLEKLNRAIHLIVPYKVIVDRIKGRWIHMSSGRVYNETFNAPKVHGKDDVTGEPLIQREDDKPDVVLRRLEHYDQMTMPVIQFYREKKIVKDFPGENSDQLWSKISEDLEKYIKKK